MVHTERMLRLILIAWVSFFALAGCTALDADERGAMRHKLERMSVGSGDEALSRRQAGASERLVMAYFVRAPASGLSLAVSDDGLTWRPRAGGPVVTPEATGVDSAGKPVTFRGLRDPCVALGPDGWYHMVWTWQMDSGWVRHIAESIGYSRSKDMLTWEPARVLPVMRDEKRFVHFCWAPEINWDDQRGEWLITWAAPVDGVAEETRAAGTNARIYACRTQDFAILGPTTIFFDPGFPVIDQAIVDTGSEQGTPAGRWLMIVKDERSEPRRKQLKLTGGSTIDGPWQWIELDTDGTMRQSAWSTAFTMHNVEGPSVVRLERGGRPWMLYYDLYEDNEYGVMVSDDLQEWRDVSARAVFPPDARHASVLRASPAVFAAIQDGVQP